MDYPSATVDGFELGMFVSNDDCGDAWVRAPDGSVATLIWETGEPAYFKVSIEPNETRWGTYAVQLPLPLTSDEEAAAYLAALLPDLRHGGKSGPTAIEVTEARADDIWRVISDVTRVGEWSDECRGARWQAGATSAAVGVSFRGRNSSGFFRWSRSCMLTTVEAPRMLAWRTVGWRGRVDSTEWRIVLEPVDGGTRIVQTYDVVRLAPGLDRVYWLLIKAHRDRRAALADDLRRLAVLATREARPVAPAAGAPSRR